jgi:hypothetical protein
MSKLTLEDIDWSKAPEDAEEGYVHDPSTIKGVGFYKGINDKNSFYYYNEYPYRGWVRSSGTPCHGSRIKRPSKTFTKSMLVAGKHIVETVGGEIYVVFSGEDGDFLLNPTNEYGWNSLSEYNEDLKCDYFDNTYDITKVYTTKGSNFYDKERLTLIWERTPPKVPTQKELQLAALQDTINKAQEQIEILMKDN